MRAWTLALFGVFCIGCPSAPSHGAPVYVELPPEEREGAPPARGPVDRAFLYQVEADIPSLILGTTNAGVRLEDTTLEASTLRGIREIIVDVRLDQITPRDLQRARTRSDALETWIGTLAWRDLLDELTGRAAREDLQPMRPWYAYGVLVSHRSEQLFEGSVPPPMGHALVLLAYDAEIPVRALDTPSERIDAMNEIPNDAMGEVLAHVIENPEQHDAHLRGLVDRYRAGDEAAMLEQLTTGLGVDASRRVYESFYLARVRAWVPELREDLDEGNVFVAVDIGHLLGPQGMLETLRGLGYSIERVD